MRTLVAIALFFIAAATPAETWRVGGKVDSFALSNLQGGAARFAPGRVTVVAFISTKCPVSNRYNQRLIDLYREYSSKGVAFLFVNSNQNEPASEVEEHSRQAGYPFPVHKDDGNRVADRFGAEFTPETYVLDAAGVIRYHGRVDDAQNPARVQHHSLRLAIDQTLAGAAVGTPETKAFGCTLKRVKKAS
ncbi:MAG: redoxin domain-containing protein [Bryobacteraceae bacterium]